MTSLYDAVYRGEGFATDLAGFLAWAKADGRPDADWTMERRDAKRLVEALDAARSVYLGFACKYDPMDVDERLDRLGKALSC